MSSTQSLYPSASSTAAASQPQDDEDWLYQHHLCETAMLVTRLVFRGEEGEEWNHDQVPSAAGTVLLEGSPTKGRVRIGRGRAARAAGRAARMGEAAAREWISLLRPHKNYPRAVVGNGKGMPPSFHLPSAPSAAGELASPPGLPPAPGLAPLSTISSSSSSSSTTITITTTMTTTGRTGKGKEGWMEGMSKRAFYKRRRKARQAAEYVVDCVLEEVDRRVIGGEGGEEE